MYVKGYKKSSFPHVSRYLFFLSNQLNSHSRVFSDTLESDSALFSIILTSGPLRFPKLFQNISPYTHTYGTASDYRDNTVVRDTSQCFKGARKPISANPRLNRPNPRIKFNLRLVSVPESAISTIPGLK